MPVGHVRICPLPRALLLPRHHILSSIPPSARARAGPMWVLIVWTRPHCIISTSFSGGCDVDLLRRMSTSLMATPSMDYMIWPWRTSFFEIGFSIILEPHVASSIFHFPNLNGHDEGSFGGNDPLQSDTLCFLCKSRSWQNGNNLFIWDRTLVHLTYYILILYILS